MGGEAVDLSCDFRLKIGGIVDARTTDLPDFLEDR